MNINPLSKEDLKVIDETIKLCDALIPIIHKSEACGNDCDEIKETLSRYRKKLEDYKREFFKRGKPLWT